MIYETAVVLRPELDEASVTAIKTLIENTIKEHSGEVLVKDDWGTKSLGQAFERGFKRGHFVYCMYKAGNEVNKELNRRLKINENVLRNLVIQLGDDKNQANLTKNYKAPQFR